MSKKWMIVGGGVIIGIIIIAAAIMIRSSQKQADQNANLLSVPSATPTMDPSVKMGALETSITLDITSPENKSTVKSSLVTVKGKTVPKAEVSVNDKDVSADANGNFSAGLTLEEGENSIIVVASDVDGNASEKEITVTYDAGGAL